MRVGDFDVTGWLWSENVGWVSLSCENTASCAVTPYGVRNDGTGQLSGSAWSENAGWIDFGPAGAGVIVDPTTGVVSGRAWAENLGWVSFASATASPPFRVETGWRCDPTPAPPSASPWLLVSHSGAEIALSWSANDGATGYDVVTGLLDDLRASGGDFSLVESCLADDLPAVELQIADADGPSRWYLVRGVNCGGEGSWDTGLPSQIGSRDPGIGASPLSCP